MPRGSNEAQPEPLQIVKSIVQRVDFELATVARSGIDMANCQSTPQPFPRDLVEARGQLGQLGVDDRRRFGQRTAEALQEGF